jgi:hypothetical protein
MEGNTGSLVTFALTLSSVSSVDVTVYYDSRLHVAESGQMLRAITPGPPQPLRCRVRIAFIY